MSNWQTDKGWSDRFIPEITRHLGQALITEPPVIEDQMRNSDLMIFSMDAVRVACRIRKNSYLKAYGGEFTLRAGRPSGTKTELTKVIEGWGSHIFYGFSDEQEKYLQQWFLGDLNLFRGWFTRQLVGLDKGQVPGIAKNNKDNSSNFAAYRLSKMPDGFIIASHGFQVEAAA